MAEETRGRASSSVILYPIVGLLAVGNLVFALLWLLGPLGPGGRQGAVGRRIEALSGDRTLTVAEGADGPAVGVEARLAAEKFDDLVRRLARLAQSKSGGELAQAFFETGLAGALTPAVEITFPSRGGAGRLEAYAIDARRQLVYCRVGAERTPIALRADAYKAIATELAMLGHGPVGGFALPFHVTIGDDLKAGLDKLKGPLQVTTIGSNPYDLLLDLPNQPELASSLQLERPDPLSLSVRVSLPPYGAMAEALALAMARASDKVTARHLDIEKGTEAVRDFARSIRRPIGDLKDALVLQYGERVRVIPSQQLVAREEAGPTAVSAPRFDGDAVVAQALDGLLAELGLLCFATGHDERRIDDTLRAGLSRPVAQLQAQGFRVQPLDLTAAKAIPGDCRAVILAGPRKPYGPAVEAMLERYLKDGGRLAVLLDPPKGPPVLDRLLARYGVAVARPEQKLPAAQLELDRTLDFVKGWTREPTVLLTAVALSVTPPEGAPWQVHCLARAFDEGPGGKAACLIAAVRPTGDARGPKLLVAGDVDAFSNQSLVGLPGSLFGKPGKLFQLPGNIELFVQAITWLAE